MEGVISRVTQNPGLRRGHIPLPLHHAAGEQSVQFRYDGPAMQRPNILSYSRLRPQRTVNALRVARWCASIPLAGGVIITVAYDLSGRYWLPLAGIAWTVFGVVLFLVGMAAASGAARLNRSASSFWLTVALLFANIPACVACFAWGYRVSSECRVTITNQTQTPISSVSVFIGMGTPVIVGPIPPRGSSRLTLRLGEGSLCGTATIGANSFAFDDRSYMTHGAGPERRTVRFSSPTTAPTISR